MDNAAIGMWTIVLSKQSLRVSLSGIYDDGIVGPHFGVCKREDVDRIPN